MAPSSLLVAAASLLLLPPTLVQGMYTKSSPVLQVDGASYQSLIAQSNHTSIVEFYAPWCGHCKNLAPAYEKAAGALAGLAKVAAVDCDAEENKPFCGRMGVQGFPTLKIIKPGKKPGKPIVEDYQGARTAKAIVEAVKEKIPNRVQKLKDGDIDSWISGEGGPKAILLSEKGTVSPLLKAVAIDFLGALDIAQVRNKDKKVVDALKVTKFPTLVLLPGEGKDPITYDGEMKKDSIVKFLSQAASPNPDPAPKDKKAKKGKASKPSKAEKAAKPKASKPAAHPDMEDGDPAECPYKGDKGEDTETEEPKKATPPPPPAPAPLIASLADELSLQQACLNDKNGLCILALLPTESTDATDGAIRALSEIQHKHAQAKRKLFPFYQLPTTNPTAATLRTELKVDDASPIALLAVNGKKAWYRAYPADSSLAHDSIEAWIDGLRMGDSTTPKHDLPEGLVVEASSLPAKEEPIKIPVNENENISREELLKMMEDLKQKLPDDLSMQLDELDDETFEQLMRVGAQMAKEEQEKEEKTKTGEAEDEGHDEL